MKILFTFKDGVTLPIRLIVSHGDYDGTTRVSITARHADAFSPEEDTEVPVPFYESHKVARLFDAIFLWLEAQESTVLSEGNAGGCMVFFDDEPPTHTTAFFRAEVSVPLPDDVGPVNEEEIQDACDYIKEELELALRDDAEISVGGIVKEVN